VTDEIRAGRRRFREMHREGFFVLPNPWDIGGVRRLEKLGFEAIASTSAGFAWSVGRDDLSLTRDEVLDHLRELCASTALPVNADFEAGFAVQPEEVAANVRMAVETGVAGLSIEDRDGGRLFELKLAASRIAASRRAIDAIDENIILVGRCESFLLGGSDIAVVIERLVAYAEAGADCLYAPGVREPAQIEAIVAAVAPKAVNVLLVRPDMRAAELRALGVRRASTGSFLARAAWAGFEDAARTLREQGALPARIYS
jgi:2-methylisocitrate lyase-like PEP mutase family enzyme